MRKEAAELHDKLKSEFWRIHCLRQRPKHLWQEAADRWLREQANKASVDHDRTILRWLEPFLAHRNIESLDRATIASLISAKLAEGRSHATVNRHLALMRCRRAPS